MKISVIVPVYKVEKYIEKCIQSLLDQTYTNFEALIVDDGSPDQSINLAKKLVSGDPRFIFLEKENGGQSSARNMGLDYASGDYIAFLDSDDYFSKDCFTAVINEFIKKPSLDIILFGYHNITEQGSIQKSISPCLDSYYSKKDILLTEETINYSVWNKVFKKAMWENFRFKEGIIYEDKEILPKVIYQKKIGSIPNHLYFYLQRAGSTMNSYNEKYLHNLIYIYQQYKDFLLKKNLYNEFELYYTKSYLKYCLYSTSLNIINYSGEATEFRKKTLNALDKKLISHTKIIKSFGLFSKYTVVSMLFIYSPSLLKKLLLKKRNI